MQITLLSCLIAFQGQRDRVLPLVSSMSKWGNSSLSKCRHLRLPVLSPILASFPEKQAVCCCSQARSPSHGVNGDPE